MNTFDGFSRNIPHVHLPYESVHNDDSEHSLLDMDKVVTHICHSPNKEFFLGDDDERMNSAEWSEKPIKEWSQEETISWLIAAASQIGQLYSSIQHTLALPGNDLIALTREDFIQRDPIYGGKLYSILYSQRNPDSLPSFNTIYASSEDEISRSVSTSNNSDAESTTSVEVTTKRLPGRPRVLNPNKRGKKQPTKGQGKLWEFIRDLLHNRDTCPRLICWEDYTQAKFRFVRSDEVAKLWGSRKENTKMTYEKLSRAMRYYYKNKVFEPVIGRRLVYKFGKNAKGWQTDDPNFCK